MPEIMKFGSGIFYEKHKGSRKIENVPEMLLYLFEECLSLISFRKILTFLTGTRLIVLKSHFFCLLFTSQNVSDSAIWGFPHLFEVELLDSRLVGSDRRALHGHVVFESGVSRVDSH